MKFQSIIYVIGLLLLALGCLMLIPAAVDYIRGDPTWQGFAEASLVTLLSGAMSSLANRPHGQAELYLRETFLLTTLSWLSIIFFAALPFIISGWASMTNALFESVSALTTTGATAMTQLEKSSYGIWLWRGMLQWVGGMGIILMAIIIFPVLNIGGMQLFYSESSDRSEKILPRVSQIAQAIFGTYLKLTLLCIFCLWIAGMPFFEAICHALGTISTGGFAISDNSIAYYNNVWIELVLVVFMILGAIALLLQVRFWRGDYKPLLQDEQTRLFLFLLGIGVGAVTLWRWLSYNVDFSVALREALFNGVSLMTSTGFTTTDYGRWGALPILVFLVLMFCGGCTGSTSGGIKIFRIKIMFELAKTHLYKLYRPHAVWLPLYNQRQIPEGVFSSVFIFITLFTITTIALTIALSLFDLDFMTCLSGISATINNIGPGFGPVVGPAGNYGSLPEGAKWILMLSMVLGRLELITVLVLFSPGFWKD